MWVQKQSWKWLVEKWLHFYTFLQRNNHGLQEQRIFPKGGWSCVTFSSQDGHKGNAHHILSNAAGDVEAIRGCCDQFILYTGLFFFQGNMPKFKWQHLPFWEVNNVCLYSKTSETRLNILCPFHRYKNWGMKKLGNVPISQCGEMIEPGGKPQAVWF